MIEVEIEDEAWTAALPDAEAVAVKAAEAALSILPRSEAYGGGRPRSGGGGEPQTPAHEVRPLHHPSGGPPPPFPLVTGEELVTILLTDDDAQRDLNHRFRGKDAATNVLSFPAPDTARPHLGDVSLAYGVCAAEAGAQGKPLGHHLAHLVAHGVLHLLGYDHQSDGEAEDMEALEREALAGLGIPDPYADRAA